MGIRKEKRQQCRVDYIYREYEQERNRERVNSCAMVNTKTWRDELRRQGTAFPAWGQQDVKNAPKQSAYAKEEIPRYESMYAWEEARTSRSGRRTCALKDLHSCLGRRRIRTTISSKTVALAIHMKAIVLLSRRRKESSESKRNTCRPSHVARHMETE